MTQADPMSKLTKASADEYHEAVVRLLLKRYRIADEHKFAMLDESERRLDIRRYTLGLFLKFFPTFPMVLQTQYFWEVRQRVSVADLFGDFSKTILVNIYDESYTCFMQDDDPRPFGMLFQWPRVRGGLVLHNHAIDTRVDGTRLLWTGKDGQLVMETLDVLLDTLDNEAPGGKGWQPEFRPYDLQT